MKTIIAGSRWINDMQELERALSACPWSGEISMVVSGCAQGVDKLGERYAEQRGLPVTYFPAHWRDKDGGYDPRAGQARNERMAAFSDALLAVWDEMSTGTVDMIVRAEKRGLRVFVYKVGFKPEEI